MSKTDSTIIFHIDVNSAFLSWTAVERLKNGEAVDIRKIPAIIGGDQSTRHGIVLAKSGPAKKYGIHTAETIASACGKCTNLQIFPPNMKLYSAYSRKMMEYLRSYTPDIEQVSVDECYMDYTGIAYQFASPMEGARIIKDGIKAQFGFTVNIGISSNKLLAKMASDFQKPDRIHTLFPGEIKEKMWPLPVSELYMAGRSSVETLKKLEIHTIGDLAQADPEILKLHLKSHGQTLWEFANGIASKEVSMYREEVKGVGNSTTVSEDIVTAEGADKVLLTLADSVAGRLRKAGQKAGMVSVEVKYATFQKTSRQRQLVRMTNTAAVIYENACELFRELWSGEPVRLLGIRTSKLEEEGAPEQMTMFDYLADVGIQGDSTSEGRQQKGSRETERIAGQKLDRLQKLDKLQKLDQTMDEIKERYGRDAITRGSELTQKRLHQ